MNEVLQEILAANCSYYEQAFPYVEVMVGRLKKGERRKHIVRVGEVANITKANLGKDIKCSWQRFGQEMLDHVQKFGSVAEFDGPTYAKFLPFDFDGDSALADARTFFKRLLQYYHVGPERLTVYFSGRRGFHIMLETAIFPDLEPGKRLYEILKDLALRLCPDADPCIYHKTALLRLPNTRHEKSGLFKVWLPVSDFFSLHMKDFKELAKCPQ